MRTHIDSAIEAIHLGRSLGGPLADGAATPTGSRSG
jgi:hypothetical protein